MTSWQVERGTKKCTACEKAFEEQENYFSALSEEKDTFRRDDYCPECWKEADREQFFSFWKTRIPAYTDEPKRRFVDTEVIYMFFSKLEDTESVEKLLFRYLLCLILVRKRFLRLDDFAKEDDKEFLVVWDRRQEKSLKVLNPDAGEEELATAQQELACIFDMPFDEDDNAQAESGSPDDSDIGDEEETAQQQLDLDEDEEEVEEEADEDEDHDIDEEEQVESDEKDSYTDEEESEEGKE
jgi:hypothetical protein